MSKIEEALKKARAAEPAQAAGGAAAAATAEPAVPPVRNRYRTGPRPSRGQMVGLSPAEQIANMEEGALRSHRDLLARRIIDGESSSSRVGNAFRQLRTALLQRTQGRNFALLVTSVADDGGASFVAQNLGAAIALDRGKTALLMDCNLRSPATGELATAPEGAPGLTDYLSDAEPHVERTIHPMGIPRLRVMPAGTRCEAGTEHFTAPRISQLLAELKRRYAERYVIVDAPPITESADSRILAELCDYVLLVVPYGRATATEVRETVESIPGERLIGCVMNDQPKVPFSRRV